ncbi:MAG: stage V sporulation protein AE [Bacilli bacterium]|nr:stage V sporulation protein AE [Mycoplasmatota bacterium]MDD6263806.1 stage V sporulation protein AE [bacterium]MDY2697681.1 stage V sporulation protein AE [Bacilli bacterium]MDD6941267.1 stage V sporulation protein AE [bacterium]MDY5993015.1 stage V sporulation protein AE [Bacilli bacterium]
MLLINSFLFCGFICMISQIILDNSKLTPGHITSILVVLGAFLDCFSWYDSIIKVVGGGALVPITSFGHSLIHGALAKANSQGLVGILMGMFDLTATGITSAIIFSFIFALIFKPRD